MNDSFSIPLLGRFSMATEQDAGVRAKTPSTQRLQTHSPDRRYFPLVISIITASHPRVPSPAIAALIAAKFRYISHLCGPSAIVPIIVVMTDISTPRHDIDFAEAGPHAHATIIMAAAEIAVYFMIALFF